MGMGEHDDGGPAATRAPIAATVVSLWGCAGAPYGEWTCATRDVQVWASTRIVAPVHTPVLAWGRDHVAVIRAPGGAEVHRRRLPDPLWIEVCGAQGAPRWVALPAGHVRHLRFVVPFATGHGYELAACQVSAAGEPARDLLCRPL
jgi:hypothetical protein